jgi:hypothetical protein
MNRRFNKTELWFLLHWRDNCRGRDNLPPVQRYNKRQWVAIHKLIDRGVAEVDHLGTRDELHFRVNWSRLDEAIAEAVR